MNKLLNNATHFFFPEIEFLSELCITDRLWIATLPLIGFSLLLLVVLNIYK